MDKLYLNFLFFVSIILLVDANKTTWKQIEAKKAEILKHEQNLIQSNIHQYELQQLDENELMIDQRNISSKSKFFDDEIANINNQESSIQLEDAKLQNLVHNLFFDEVAEKSYLEQLINANYSLNHFRELIIKKQLIEMKRYNKSMEKIENERKYLQKLELKEKRLHENVVQYYSEVLEKLNYQLIMINKTDFMQLHVIKNIKKQIEDIYHKYDLDEKKRQMLSKLEQTYIGNYAKIKANLTKYEHLLLANLTELQMIEETLFDQWIKVQNDLVLLNEQENLLNVTFAVHKTNQKLAELDIDFETKQQNKTDSNIVSNRSFKSLKLQNTTKPEPVALKSKPNPVKAKKNYILGMGYKPENNEKLTTV
ncbi:hypothetical protein BLOT_007527 [Blomia tropicalis]|nr:hypothetical protein BLOT_007527 [Blomia tropicalis]